MIWTVISLAVVGSGAYGFRAYSRAQAILTYMDGAHMAEHCGDLAAAEKQYRQALGVDPRYLAARTGLADVYFEQSDPDKALREHRRGVAADPGNPEAHIALARGLIGCRRYEEAAECLGRGIEIVPSDIQMRVLLQHVYRWTGQRDKAARALAELRKLAPNDASVKNAERAAWAEAVRAQPETQRPRDRKKASGAATPAQRSASAEPRPAVR